MPHQEMPTGLPIPSDASIPHTTTKAFAALLRMKASSSSAPPKGSSLPKKTSKTGSRCPASGTSRSTPFVPAGKNLYIAADSGVYRYRPGGMPERLFISRGKTTGEGIIPRQVKVDVMTPSMLWLCTSRGVYRSTDRGESWQKFHVEGADLFEARCLVQFPLDAHHFYLVSEAGLFKVNIPENKTTALYAGLPTANIHWADIDAEGKLYVACDQGLFHQENKTPQSAAQPLGLQALLAGEPSITQVQEAAMRYNSVHPDKTADWRKRIKYRALMPKLSVDYDKTIGSSFTSSGYYYAEGPNDWGVSLTWDMGNLIWNSYEDDIDNRTKLTTQLRMDILDEINRLYFERLRLKHEIATGNADNEDTTLHSFASMN